MKKISIIIPVYMVEKYLERCIRSILQQTYKNIEVILIDDGTKDGSGDICDVFAKEDDRIIVLHKENGGQSSARNLGLKVATGEYIGFVDSDDYIEPTMYEALMNLVSSTESDIAVCTFNTFKENSLEEYNKVFLKNENYTLMTSEEALKAMYQKNKFGCCIWNKLYKRELFEGIEFPEGIFGEDFVFNCYVIDKAKKIAYSDTELYHYLVREDSSMHGEFSRKNFGSLTSKDMVYDFINNKYPSFSELIRVYYTICAFKLLVLMVASRYYNKQDYDMCYRYLNTYKSNLIRCRNISMYKKVLVLTSCQLKYLFIYGAKNGGIMNRLCLKMKMYIH